MTAAGVVRVSRYCHLDPFDRDPPPRSKVFFDPADTEVGVWATVDLVEPGSTVLDLGSGSGAAAGAVGRAGAAHVHGLDVSAESVDWATEHYGLDDGTRRVTFGVADYTLLSPAELLDTTPLSRPPDVVASNPPYVPIPATAGRDRVSIDGGSDGLRLVRTVVRHAAELGSSLGLTIGSYSSVRLAASLLAESGYAITGLTLSALRLGAYTLRHPERVLELEAMGEGPLLRPDDGAVYYLILGMSCRLASSSKPASPSGPVGDTRRVPEAPRVRVPVADHGAGGAGRPPVRVPRAGPGRGAARRVPAPSFLTTWPMG